MRVFSFSLESERILVTAQSATYYLSNDLPGIDRVKHLWFIDTRPLTPVTVHPADTRYECQHLTSTRR